MPAPHDTLLLSSARQVDPKDQRQREESLLARARLGEIHLHVSTLHGQLLALGLFHPPLPTARARIWRRHTGGRAVAAGDGFLIITLALPSRAVLGEALRPEQVLNRGVRGLLHWLRTMRIEPVYPGLDFVTVQGQRLAHLSFVEGNHGELLIQIILSQTTSLAETMLRLDHLDPEGVVPSMVWLPEESTTLDRLPAATRTVHSPGSTLGPLGSAYAELLDLGVGVYDTRSLDRGPAAADAFASPPEATGSQRVQIEGRLGPVVAAIGIKDGRFNSVDIAGDFIAPANFGRSVTDALLGKPATPETLHAEVAELFDQQGLYALGMDRALFEHLLVRALESTIGGAG